MVGPGLGDQYAPSKQPVLDQSSLTASHITVHKREKTRRHRRVCYGRPTPLRTGSTGHLLAKQAAEDLEDANKKARNSITEGFDHRHQRVGQRLANLCAHTRVANVLAWRWVL